MKVNVKRAYRTKYILGLQVKNPEHEQIGDVDELVIDLESGEVAYAVVSFGGFLGFGEKIFAVPWNELTLENDEAGRFFVLATSREKLGQLPGFDKNDWPDTTSADWQSEIAQHYSDSSSTAD